MLLSVQIETPEQHTWTVCWHPNGKLLAVGGSDKKLSLWAANNELTAFNKQHVIFGDSNRSIRSIAFSPDGKMMCSGSFDSTISVYISVGGDISHLTKLEGHENEVKCVSWSPSGKKIASCSRDKNIYVWERNTEGDDFLCENVLQGHTQDVKWVNWIDNATLVSSSYDNTIRVWEYEDDDMVSRQIIEGHTSTVWAVAIHPPTRNLISVSDDCTIRVWSAQGSGKYQQVQCIEGLHTAQIYSVDVDSTNQFVATGDGSGRLVVSRITNTGMIGDKLLEQHAHQGDVNCVRFNPVEPRTIATSGDDGIVRIWKF